ncbi:MAG: protoporphyrinogen oxidase HemJ [Proteobacteria bacterium]|nr:protoporphyrinogen oxidase HemJ [Pseudomonadota bacterium]
MAAVLDVLAGWYPWIKALHVISVIAWMAGLFYLPRLFVYHCRAQPGSEMSETFKVMERRLLRAIMNPASIAAWVFGLGLILTPGIVDWTLRWWQVKVAAALLLTYYHHLLARWRKDFAADRNPRPEKFYRAMNEAPTVLMIVIVIMVIVRPLQG